jgi:hypothetical protein
MFCAQDETQSTRQFFDFSPVLLLIVLATSIPMTELGFDLFILKFANGLGILAATRWHFRVEEK